MNNLSFKVFDILNILCLNNYKVNPLSIRKLNKINILYNIPVRKRTRRCEGIGRLTRAASLLQNPGSTVRLVPKRSVGIVKIGRQTFIYLEPVCTLFRYEAVSEHGPKDQTRSGAGDTIQVAKNRRYLVSGNPLENVAELEAVDARIL
jgi:hypothetical protein